MKIIDIEVKDVRFPTSRQLDGSDAMNAAPDYSCAYVVVKTDGPHNGHGLSFTIGRGTEVCVRAIESLASLVVGRRVEDITMDMGVFWRELVGDSQLRWIGPEKGAIHLGCSAVLNALWDLWARMEGKPLWKLVVDMSPEEFVGCIDFRYLSNFLDKGEALELLRKMEASKSERVENLSSSGLPAYTTSAGWLGYDDDKMRRLCREALDGGWEAFKLKVGGNIEEDLRRAAIMRECIGYERRFIVDANQVWEVDEAIECMKRFAVYKPWFIEEPTSPDDALGHAEIKKALEPYGIGVATGEHGMNGVFFKQLFQANSITVCQPDACRLGGVNEFLAVLLMAAKQGVPVCPHGGGVGLCEQVQHLSVIDYVCISGSLEDRYVEYVDHLHEHFENPVKMYRSNYLLPDNPGYSTKMFRESLEEFAFPNGKAWK